MDHLFNLDEIQKSYSLKNIIPKNIIDIGQSNRKNKKYYVLLDDKGKTIRLDFGDKRYHHYHDKIGAYGYLDHNDMKRRDQYLARATYITDKHGFYTCDDIYSPNFYSIRLLW